MPKRREREYQLGDYWLSRDPKSGNWCRAWYDKAQRQTRRASFSTEDFERAKGLLENWWIERHRPEEQPSEKVQLAELLMIYFQEHARPWASEDQAAAAIAHAADFFQLDSITTAAGRVTEYIDHRRAAGRKDTTISRELSVFNAAGNYAVKRPRGAVLRAFRPFSSDGLADSAEDKRPRGAPASLDMMARAIDAISKRDEHLFLFTVLTINTLCRPSAALDLLLDGHQVDLEHGLVGLNPKGRSQTKKYRPILPMTESLRPWLATAMKATPRRERFVMRWVKRHEEWRTVDSVKTGIRGLRKNSKLPDDFTAYSFRHGLARELRRRGVPKEQVEYQLGHRWLSTTDIYAPYEPSFNATARDALDGILLDLDKLTDRSLLKPIAPVALDLRRTKGVRHA